MENAPGRYKIDFIIFVTSVQLVLRKNNVYAGLSTFNVMSIEKKVAFCGTCNFYLNLFNQDQALQGS